MSQGNFIRKVIYRFTRRYPASIDFYTRATFSTDYETGAITKTLTKTTAKCALLTTKGALQQLDLGTSYKGGYFDSHTRIVLVKASSLGSYVPDAQDWLVISGKRYEIKEIQNLFDVGFILIIRHVEGQATNAVYELAVSSAIAVSQEYE